MADTSIPVRTCVGCRARSPVTDLLRVVVVDGVLTPDPRRVLPGRGASLHPTPECLHAAERRRAFPRALRRSAPVEAGPLRAHVLGAPPAAPAATGPGPGEIPPTEVPQPGTANRPPRTSRAGRPRMSQP